MTPTLQSSMYAQLQAEDRLRNAGPSSSNPPDPGHARPQDPQERDGEDEPIYAIEDPELRNAVMRAHRSWALRFCPWTLEEWFDG